MDKKLGRKKCDFFTYFPLDLSDDTHEKHLYDIACAGKVVPYHPLQLMKVLITYT